MTIRDVSKILQQAKEIGSIDWIYFEGGEPFLFYPVMLKGIQEAAKLGFKVGIVTNGYWATSLEDARVNLKPFAGILHDLSVSSDLFHYDERISRQCQWAVAVADELGIPVGVISIAQPGEKGSTEPMRQLPVGESEIMFRGRAVEKLITGAAGYHWDQFTECPHEDLREPGRVHLDAFGNVQICQGISIGNYNNNHLLEIFNQYDDDKHPISSALIQGGPAELVRQYGISHQESYADACHLCYESRLKLRNKFPEILAPDQVYGVFSR